LPHGTDERINVGIEERVCRQDESLGLCVDGAVVVVGCV
jgi:hypothetical protein